MRVIILVLTFAFLADAGIYNREEQVIVADPVSEEEYAAKGHPVDYHSADQYADFSLEDAPFARAAAAISSTDIKKEKDVIVEQLKIKEPGPRKPYPPPGYSRMPLPPPPGYDLPSYDDMPPPPPGYGKMPPPPRDYENRPSPPRDYENRPPPPREYEKRPPPPPGYPLGLDEEDIDLKNMEDDEEHELGDDAAPLMAGRYPAAPGRPGRPGRPYPPPYPFPPPPRKCPNMCDLDLYKKCTCLTPATYTKDGRGNCNVGASKLDLRVWCYVDESNGSPQKVCPDALPSKSKPGFFWSRIACITG